MSSSGTLVLTDSDVDALMDMPMAMSTVRRALMAKAKGAWVAPPRRYVEFPGSGELVFTIGGGIGQAVAGFRAYDTFGGPDAAHVQIVAVWETATAKLVGIVLGERLGELRTGAIGGLAVELMASPHASVCAVIGSGDQASSQLEAAAAARCLREVRVHSRSADRRTAFATRMRERLGIPAWAVTTAEEAVRGADVVLVATTSEIPVISAEWLKAGAHVNTVGPKTSGRSELGSDVVARAALISTDSPEQARAYDAPFFLEPAVAMNRIVDLSELVAGRINARTAPDDITLFCSVGLAGTEVVVAAEALRRHRERQASDQRQTQRTCAAVSVK